MVNARSSIVERMPVLVTNQTSTTNNEEQTYEQEESPSFNGNNTSLQTEPVVKKEILNSCFC